MYSPATVIEVPQQWPPPPPPRLLHPVWWENGRAPFDGRWRYRIANEPAPPAATTAVPPAATSTATALSSCAAERAALRSQVLALQRQLLPSVSKQQDARAKLQQDLERALAERNAQEERLIGMQRDLDETRQRALAERKTQEERLIGMRRELDETRQRALAERKAQDDRTLELDKLRSQVLADRKAMDDRLGSEGARVRMLESENSRLLTERKFTDDRLRSEVARVRMLEAENSRLSVDFSDVTKRLQLAESKKCPPEVSGHSSARSELVTARLENAALAQRFAATEKMLSSEMNKTARLENTVSGQEAALRALRSQLDRLAREKANNERAFVDVQKQLDNCGGREKAQMSTCKEITSELRASLEESQDAAKQLETKVIEVGRSCRELQSRNDEKFNRNLARVVEKVQDLHDAWNDAKMQDDLLAIAVANPAPSQAKTNFAKAIRDIDQRIDLLNATAAEANRNPIINSASRP